MLAAFLGVRDMQTRSPVERLSLLRAGGLITDRRPALACGAALITLTSAAVWLASGGAGTLRAAYLSISGQVIAVDSATKSFGAVREGAPASVQFRLTNRGRRPVRIVGCAQYCNCVASEELPLTIGPGESHDLKIAISTSDSKAGMGNEPISQPLTLYTTSPGQAEIELTIKGEIHGSAGSEGSPL
jgi:hypothetical protein